MSAKPVGKPLLVFVSVDGVLVMVVLDTDTSQRVNMTPEALDKVLASGLKGWLSFIQRYDDNSEHVMMVAPCGGTLAQWGEAMRLMGEKSGLPHEVQWIGPEPVSATVH